MMRWLAIHFGKKIEFKGPIVFGIGYKWFGKIWFPKIGGKQ
jgi:hypothetical protein